MSSRFGLMQSEFDAILERHLKRLPPDVRRMLETVPILVEDEPSFELMREMGMVSKRGDEIPDLCGLHWGIPVSERTTLADPSMTVDRIYLFRGPIQRSAGDDADELNRQIWITLLHEIGHHFGLSEERLDELGYG